MSEQSRFNEALPPAPAEQDILVLIRKMQQQLVFLEKKIDTLINQSHARPFNEKHISKPFRSFGRPYHHSNKAHVSASGEKGFDRGRHFEKRHDGEKKEFDQKKKPFSYRRKDHR